MPLFTKALLFFSVPVILFSLFATPALKKNEKAPTGDAWLPLAAGGVGLVVPSEYRLQDPLTTDTEQLAHRWAMSWPDKEIVHGAHVRAGNDFQVFVFAGPSALLDPIVQEARGYYRESRMVERDEPHEWTTPDGLVFRVDKVRYLPGVLSGDDTSLVLASARHQDLTVVLNAGGPSERMPLGALESLVSGLTLDL
ncbi:MAG: hypothetical protein AAF682_30770 [Planctomycetota bacterium]